MTQPGVNAGVSYKVQCTTKEVSYTAYNSNDCTGDAGVKASYVWGKCLKMGNIYVKATGAMAMQSAAIAAVAFVGSQF